MHTEIWFHRWRTHSTHPRRTPPPPPLFLHNSFEEHLLGRVCRTHPRVSYIMLGARKSLPHGATIILDVAFEHNTYGRSSTVVVVSDHPIDDFTTPSAISRQYAACMCTCCTFRSSISAFTPPSHTRPLVRRQPTFRSFIARFVPFFPRSLTNAYSKGKP